MNIIIFSRSAESYFNLKITDEAKKFGIHCRIINPLHCSLYHDTIICNSEVLKDADLCILRTPPYREEKEFFHLAARLMESQGVCVVNSPGAVEISGNKFLTCLKLTSAGIPVLPSVAIRSTGNVDGALECVGGFPVFLKTVFGTRGIGVIYCDNRETLVAAAQTMWAYHANVFIEKYARKSGGKTIRALVCRGKVHGAIQCSAYQPAQAENHNKLLRSNFSRGGVVEPFEINDELSALAVSAAETIGLDFAGVDLIPDGEEYKVLEINSSPGIKGFEKGAGKNVAGQILKTLLYSRELNSPS